MSALSEFKTETNKILELINDNQHLRNEIRDLRKILNDRSQSLVRNSLDISLVVLSAVKDANRSV